ncbi:MAG: hypothetical protein R3B82_12335 [Sandaracinaceae bacterium]
MPYRADGRSDEARAARVAELEQALEEAEKRVRAAAGAVHGIERRFDAERRAIETAIADAEDAQRRAVHHALALGGEADPKLRDRMRTGGAVTALARAMATRERPSMPPPPPGAVEELQAELRALRGRRAKLHARAEEDLAVARARLADAVAIHDEAVLVLEDARASTIPP